MEMLVIFVVALLVLGPSKLPEAGRQVGRALAEFRRWSTGVQSELREALDVEPAPDYGRSVPASEMPSDVTPEREPQPRSPSQFPDAQSFS